MSKWHNNNRHNITFNQVASDDVEKQQLATKQLKLSLFSKFIPLQRLSPSFLTGKQIDGDDFYSIILFLQQVILSSFAEQAIRFDDVMTDFSHPNLSLVILVHSSKHTKELCLVGRSKKKVRVEQSHHILLTHTILPPYFLTSISSHYNEREKVNTTCLESKRSILNDLVTH